MKPDRLRRQLSVSVSMRQRTRARFIGRQQGSHGTPSRCASGAGELTTRRKAGSQRRERNDLNGPNTAEHSGSSAVTISAAMR